MPNLVRLVYVSEATVKFTEAEFAALLKTSQANNAVRGVTGILLFAAGNFIQVLEGPADAVQERYDVIATDPRHRRVSRLLCEATTDRLFGQWSMGWVPAERVSPLDRLELRRLVQWADDPTQPTDRTQVHNLLRNFADQMARSAKAA